MLDDVGTLLRLYESEVLVPLVEDAGLKPVRADIDFMMMPGTIIALMNNADDFNHQDDIVFWHPLTVLYTDKNGSSDTVFSLEASFDPKTETVFFQKAVITGVVELVRRDDHVVWIDPLSGVEFQRFPLEAADKVLMNAWYLFRGAVLPMLFNESFRFVSGVEQAVFQRVLIRQIHELYKDVKV